jgi:hypothetical protein
MANPRFSFTRATKKQLKLRMTLDGLSGGGKTYTALLFARTLVAHYGGRIAVVDTENRSASKYADEFEFDVLELEQFDPYNYIEAIHAAEEAGYTVLVVDSLSHAWAGTGGVLDKQGQVASRVKNSITAWREVTPQHNALVDALVRCRIHLICTMRSKMDYLINQEGGRTSVEAVGLKPIQRDGVEYEFDIVGDMSREDHSVFFGKSRCKALDQKTFHRPGAEVMHIIIAWLEDGEEPHWSTDPQAKDQLKTKIQILGLSVDQVLQALSTACGREIARVSDYPGTLLEAMQALQEFKYAQQEEVSQQAETTALPEGQPVLV